MCHRPKVDLLPQCVAARSRTVARVLAQAQFKREGTARLVLRTHGLVAAVEREEPGSDAALQALLEQQQGHLLGRLQWEEAVLLAETHRALRRTAASHCPARSTSAACHCFAARSTPVDRSQAVLR